MSPALLEVRDLEVAYSNAAIIRKVSLEVGESESVGILGANGAGKTTLLRTISGLKRAAHGQIRFDGSLIGSLRPHIILRLGLAQVPERRELFPEMTVLENLEMGGYRAPSASARRDGIEKAFHYFPRLKERRSQQAGTLSGGEQQMLAIARALVIQPRLLMLDEPSIGLSPLILASVFEILDQLHKDGLSLLVVEQNASMTLRHVNRAYVLQTGSLVAHGTSEELLGSDDIRRTYLGG